MTVIAGGSRCNSKYFAWHLQRTDKGQTVEVRDVVGLMGDNMRGWFEQIEAMALGGRTTNTFYHFSLNPREGEAFSPEQEKVAVATALKNLGLEDQPYFVVKHGGKDGRPDHYHCVALRVDLDTGKAISDSNNYDIHMKTAAQLEKQFGHDLTERGRGPGGPNPKNYEVMRGKETGIDPNAVGVELTALWQQTDSPQAFAAALAEQGYILAEGRRGLCAVDAGAKEHSLARRIEGARKKDIDARFSGFDRSELPTVEAARAMARERKKEPKAHEQREEAQPDPATPAPDPSPGKHRKPHEQREEAQPDPAPSPAPLSPTPAGPASGKRPRSRFGELVEELFHTIKNAFTRKDVPQLTMGELAPVEEGTAFERAAQELVRDAREAGPMAGELAAGAALLEGEHLLFAKKEPEATLASPAAPQPSAFDRVAQQVKQAVRETTGDDELMTAGLDWLARQTKAHRSAASPPDREPTAFERMAEDTKDAMRDNGGQPVTLGEVSFWQRSLQLATATAERLAGWVKASWQEIVGQFTRGRDPGHDDPGFER
jgi:hypothetical protein